MATVNLSELEGRLLRPAEPGEFTAAEWRGCRSRHAGTWPRPSRRGRRWRPPRGCGCAATVKVGRWLPFRAREVLDPHHGFVWAARAAGVIAGSDRYLDGVAIPAAGRAGWFFGTDRWPGGEFLRYRITDLHLVTTAAGREPRRQVSPARSGTHQGRGRPRGAVGPGRAARRRR